MPLISRGSFNGGTITGPLVIDLFGQTVNAPSFQLLGPSVGVQDLLLIKSADNAAVLEVFQRNGVGGGTYIASNDPNSIVLYVDGQLASPQVADVLRVVDKDGAAAIRAAADGGLGFYGHAAAAQQSVTSGSVTPAQLANALQANGTLGGT